MGRFLLRRLFSGILVMLGLLVLAFVLQIVLPGDPTDQWFRENDQTSGTAQERAAWRQKLGLDLPVFYLSLGTLTDDERSQLSISAPSGQPDQWRRHVPVLHWHADNRFHRWLFGDGAFSKGILRGDFGISWNTRQPVMDLLGHRIGWSILLTFVSLLLAYALSLPVALRSARSPGSAFDRRFTRLRHILLSLPVFWVAGMLLLLLANPYALKLFPSSGVAPAGGWSDESGWIGVFAGTLPYLVLPTLAYCYGSWAYLSGQFRENLLREKGADYFRTALAKGLDPASALHRHAFRNTWIQAFALFGFAFPAAIGGSIVIESVFSIPGMGYTVYEAIDARDYPVMNAVFLLSGLFTVSGLLLSDLLVYWSDPRIHAPSESASAS
jgi:peptide/nickel transport system permease protein